MSRASRPPQSGGCRTRAPRSTGQAPQSPLPRAESARREPQTSLLGVPRPEPVRPPRDELGATRSQAPSEAIGDPEAEATGAPKGIENYEKLKRDKVADTIKTPHARDAAGGTSPMTAEGPAC